MTDPFANDELFRRANEIALNSESYRRAAEKAIAAASEIRIRDIPTDETLRRIAERAASSESLLQDLARWDERRIQASIDDRVTAAFKDAETRIARHLSRSYIAQSAEASTDSHTSESSAAEVVEAAVEELKRPEIFDAATEAAQGFPADASESALRALINRLPSPTNATEWASLSIVVVVWALAISTGDDTAVTADILLTAISHVARFYKLMKDED